MPRTTPQDLPLVVIVGATATGKSDLAVALALACGGEVINADALQLYRGMDIGTAKITPAERRGVPHHLLDVLDVSQDASVSAYQRAARRAVTEIRGRGNIPVAVGGSGLYIRALIDDILFPPTDPQVRSALERRVEHEGPAVLHAELARRDAQAAATIAVADVRRVIRALEVVTLTGQPFAAFLPEPRYHDPATIQIGLRRDRTRVHARVHERVHDMVAAGLLDEVRSLRPLGIEDSPTARHAIGYEQALAVLDGRLDCAEAIEQTVIGTRRLVRKQDTWFRRDDRVHWLDADAAGADLSRLTAAARDLVDRVTALGEDTARGLGSRP